MGRQTLVNVAIKKFPRKGIALLALAILGSIIYSNSLSGEFVCDDFGSILAHKAVLAQFNWHRLWQAYDTRIMGGLTFALNYWFTQEKVVSYHVLNIVIHIVNSFLVYLLALQIFRTPRRRDVPLQKNRSEVAFFTALLFLVHPMQTQAVAYIVQRYTSLATLFYLSAVVAYGKARLENKNIFYVIAFCCGVLSFMTKEMTCTLFVMIIIYDAFFWGFRKSDVKRWLGILVGGFVLMGAMLMIAKTREEQKLFLTPDLVNFPTTWQYVLTEINVLRTYLRLLFFPYKQSHSYDYAIAQGLAEPGTIGSLVLLLGILGGAVWLFKRGHRVLSFGIVWFFLTVSVQGIFVILYGKCGAGFMYDHWVYLPMVGFCLFVSAGIMLLFRQTKMVVCIMSVLVAIYGFLTFERNKVWRTEITLWEDVLLNNPKTVVNHLALGCAYDRKELYSHAEAAYRHGLRLVQNKPLDQLLPVDKIYTSRIYNNLGLLAFDSGNDLRAIEAFKKALIYDPRNASVYLNLGIVFYNRQQYPEVLKTVTQYLKFDQGNPYAYYYLGFSSLALGDQDHGREFLTRASALFRQQKNEEVIKEIQEALEADKRHAP